MYWCICYCTYIYTHYVLYVFPKRPDSVGFGHLEWLDLGMILPRKLTCPLQKWWLEDYFSFEVLPFQGDIFNFWEGMNMLRCSTYPYKSQGHLKPKSPAAVSEKARPSEKAAGGEGFAQRLPGQSAGSKDSPRGSIEEWWMLTAEAWLHPCSQWGFTCLRSCCFSFFWYIYIYIIISKVSQTENIILINQTEVVFHLESVRRRSLQQF